MTDIREDAVFYGRRWYVPTTENTKWIETWAEFKAAGGVTQFEEDQTAITLILPAPYKFSIQFQREALNPEQ